MDVAVSTARAGNVIGGGDFANDRIIPDCVRAAKKKEDIIVRNPHSTRPYQHVLEPLAMYLTIAKEQYEDKKYAGFYNVGPDDCDCVTTGELVDIFCAKWGEDMKWVNKFMGGPHEANFLKLDCSKVKTVFGLNAFMALTSPLLGERQVKPGDEMITVAAGFPTTVTPAIQYGVVPVFVDVTIPQYNIDVTQLEAALSDKTKVVMAAHTLGNPFDLSAVKTFCDKHNLWLIEDNCDALGSKYVIDGEEKFTGTIGDIGTSSFYPPHHMTMGEGGAVYTNDPLLNKCIRSMRDWGRDCVCASGQDNLCGHRFDKQYGELPLGYDHKYVYSHFGYNLKATDMQAAVGCAQIVKFPKFVERRRENFDRLKAGLAGTEDKLILPVPCENSRPSWFGFLITCKEGVDRNKVVQLSLIHI